MDTIANRYRVGHHNARRLLGVLANQLRAFEHGRTPDLLLMRDILDCLNRYVAISDGAYESRLIDALTRADDHFAPARLVLTTEHEAITEIGQRCLALLEDMIGGIVVPRSELLTPGQRYLRIYQDHLRRERSYLKRHRNEIDETIATHLRQPLPEDPIGEFKDLCERITQAAAHWETDEFGLSVCPACGTDAASTSDAQSIPLGS